MNIQKYIYESLNLPNISKSTYATIEKTINLYPKINIPALVDMVKKQVDLYEEIKDTLLIKLFSTTLNNNWRELNINNLLMWDIAIELRKRGFVGASVDEYLIGLILNHIYREFATIDQIKDFIDKVSEYLISKKEATFSSFVKAIRQSKFVKNKAIPFEVLQKQASRDVEEWESIVAEVERQKNDYNSMEHL